MVERLRQSPAALIVALLALWVHIVAPAVLRSDPSQPGRHLVGGLIVLCTPLGAQQLPAAALGPESGAADTLETDSRGVDSSGADSSGTGTPRGSGKVVSCPICLAQPHSVATLPPVPAIPLPRSAVLVLPPADPPAPSFPAAPRLRPPARGPPVLA